MGLVMVERAAGPWTAARGRVATYVPAEIPATSTTAVPIFPAVVPSTAPMLAKDHADDVTPTAAPMPAAVPTLASTDA
jgi:hypothetical protein